MSPTGLVCAGCDAVVPPGERYPFRCPAAVDGDGIDHVLERRIEPTAVGLDGPAPTPADNPFVLYRQRLHSYHRALARGWSDRRFVDLVETVDEQVAAVDGRGFRITPFLRAETLTALCGMDAAGGGVWVKDETRNVSGSHKSRHLMGILLHLLVVEEDRGVRRRPPLAIASCGNAALAAAVLARAVQWPLEVYVPPDAAKPVLDRLRSLGARIVACPRQPGEHGDPCYLRFREASGRGAIPFTCQGPQNGLAIEGGETLVYEMLEVLLARGQQLDRIFVQVGGGALASACVHGFREARDAALISGLPKVHGVQSRGAYPLALAWARLLERTEPIEERLRFAASHRSLFMRPWPAEPHGVAHGILDDETYDWLAVARGMLESGGAALVVDEAELLEANSLARRATGIAVDPTGSAGLAGLLSLLRVQEVGPREAVAVLFTGVDRGLEAGPQVSA